MDQVKTGRLIAMQRHKKQLTQKELAQQLGVSDRAVSKWERGICFMDVSLLKPLSEILEIGIVDILSGEIVPEEQRKEKYEESMEDIAKLNETKSKAFGMYGFLLSYLVFIIYETCMDIPFDNIVSMLMCFISFKFFYKYRLDFDRSNLIMFMITLGIAVLMAASYVWHTW